VREGRSGPPSVFIAAHSIDGSRLQTEEGRVAASAQSRKSIEQALPRPLPEAIPQFDFVIQLLQKLPKIVKRVWFDHIP
jgi:hypothetical protein